MRWMFFTRGWPGRVVGREGADVLGDLEIAGFGDGEVGFGRAQREVAHFAVAGGKCGEDALQDAVAQHPVPAWPAMILHLAAGDAEARSLRASWPALGISR